MTIDAPCRSAFASRHGAAKKFGASDTGAALVPTALRLPPAIILRSFAACLSVPKASKGSNAFYFTLVVEYQSLRNYDVISYCFSLSRQFRGSQAAPLRGDCLQLQFADPEFAWIGVNARNRRREMLDSINVRDGDFHVDFLPFAVFRGNGPRAAEFLL